MIIVNLKGGLGNQMFQYALGRKLAIKNSDVLKLETSGLSRANDVGDIYRPFSLASFNIKGEIATPEEVQRLKYPYGILSKAWRFVNQRILRQIHTLFDPTVLDWQGDIFLDGYWQSPKYFDDIREILVKEFTLKHPYPDMDMQLYQTESVSIHIRRGDYVKNPKVTREFGVCSQEYYRAAIRHRKNIHPSATFFVFSDDIDWVKGNLGLEDTAVYISSPELTDAIELYLMSRCKHNIIANSTFSWWGAWLNTNPNKIIIAPSPWFDTIPYDKYLIPDSWIKLPKN